MRCGPCAAAPTGGSLHRAAATGRHECGCSCKSDRALYRSWPCAHRGAARLDLPPNASFPLLAASLASWFARGNECFCGSALLGASLLGASLANDGRAHAAVVSHGFEQRAALVRGQQRLLVGRELACLAAQPPQRREDLGLLRVGGRFGELVELGVAAQLGQPLPQRRRLPQRERLRCAKRGPAARREKNQVAADGFPALTGASSGLLAGRAPTLMRALRATAGSALSMFGGLCGPVHLETPPRRPSAARTVQLSDTTRGRTPARNTLARAHSAPPRPLSPSRQPHRVARAVPV